MTEIVEHRNIRFLHFFLKLIKFLTSIQDDLF